MIRYTKIILSTRNVKKYLCSSRYLHFYLETYGCQMNLSDSEIVRGLLIKSGHVSVDNIDAAEVILTNTCAIRENAENKVWNR